MEAMARKIISLKVLKETSIPILKKNGVKKAGIFGSYARGSPKLSSDIDFVIEFRGQKSLLDLSGLKIELEEKFNKKVDILTYKSLHHLIRNNILNEEVKIL